MQTRTRTFVLTPSQIHILMDALSRHEIAIAVADRDHTGEEPTDIYRGVFPVGHPLRDPVAYRTMLHDAAGIVNDLIALRENVTLSVAVPENR